MVLDHLLAKLLAEARAQGHEPAEVLTRLERMVKPCVYERILIIEPDAAMRAILLAEMEQQLKLPIEAAAELTVTRRVVVVALPTRAMKLRRSLPEDVLCVPLKLCSLGASIQGQSKPQAETVIAIASKSAEVLQWTRAMLIAVRLDPDSICEIKASAVGWKDRLPKRGLVITDIVTACELPAGCQARVVRVIADSSITELKQLFAPIAAR